jgi:hypothetical protein|tara:strand:- start:2630 stop:3001 length:372 start_codon:yes stop_codon:yes gene_type:complete
LTSKVRIVKKGDCREGTIFPVVYVDKDTDLYTILDGSTVHVYHFTELMEVEEDLVNHPPHYGDGNIECIDYMEDNMKLSMFLGYLEGNVKKYMHRYRYKNGLQDLHKAQWYLSRLIITMEKHE